MIPSKLKFNKNREGFVLAFVLIIFLVIAIITSSVAFMFSSNLKMAKTQENNMRVHYLLKSGIDMTLSTLLSTLNVEDGEEKTIIDKIKKDNTTIQLTDDVDIDGNEVQITVDYIKDTSEITIKSSTIVDSGATKELSLRLEWSGNSYRTRWIK